MEVTDILSNIEVQGPVIIKKWDDEKEDFEIILETDQIEMRKGERCLEDLEIQYMYVADDTLVMEVQDMYE